MKTKSDVLRLFCEVLQEWGGVQTQGRQKLNVGFLYIIT